MRFHNICLRTANWSVRKWRYEPIKTGLLRSGGAFCTLPENVKKAVRKRNALEGMDMEIRGKMQIQERFCFECG